MGNVKKKEQTRVCVSLKSIVKHKCDGVLLFPG